MHCDRIRVGDHGQRFELTGSLGGGPVRALAWADDETSAKAMLASLKKWPAVDPATVTYRDRGPNPPANGGAVAIVCGTRPKPKRCSSCNALGAERLCDWKNSRMHAGKMHDCDRPICARCSTVPSVDKDLCREHAEKWATTLAGEFGGPRA